MLPVFIKQAKRRAETMGKYSSHKPEYDSNPLAACVSNHVLVISAEMLKPIAVRDYFMVLYCISQMANRINDYCDQHQVKGNSASEYWLEYFLWYVDTVCII